MHKFDRGHWRDETQGANAPVNPSAGAKSATRPRVQTPPQYPFDRGQKRHETQPNDAPVNPSAGASSTTRPILGTPPQYTKGDNEQWT